MISLTNRHTAFTDKIKLVYSTLALNQTRESVKNSSWIFNSFFLSSRSRHFVRRLLLATSFLNTQKLYHHVASLLTAIIYFPLDLMKDTKIMSDSSCCCSSISSWNYLNNADAITSLWKTSDRKLSKKLYIIYHHYHRSLNSQIFFHTTNNMNMEKKNVVHRKKCCTYEWSFFVCIYRIKPNRKINFLFTPNSSTSHSLISLHTNPEQRGII